MHVFRITKWFTSSSVAPANDGSIIEICYGPKLWIWRIFELFWINVSLFLIEFWAWILSDNIACWTLRPSLMKSPAIPAACGPLLWNEFQRILDVLFKHTSHILYSSDGLSTGWTEFTDILLTSTVFEFWNSNSWKKSIFKYTMT